MNWSVVGKMVMSAGALIFVIGLVIFLLGKTNIGTIPGDIVIKKGNFTFFFPVVTCIIISVVLSLISMFFRR